MADAKDHGASIVAGLVGSAITAVFGIVVWKPLTSIMEEFYAVVFLVCLLGAALSVAWLMGKGSPEDRPHAHFVLPMSILSAIIWFVLGVWGGTD